MPTDDVHVVLARLEEAIKYLTERMADVKDEIKLAALNGDPTARQSIVLLVDRVARTERDIAANHSEIGALRTAIDARDEKRSDRWTSTAVTFVAGVILTIIGAYIAAKSGVHP